MRLEDKVTIITGAASGFGLGSARMFAAEGAKVVAADINGEALEEAVAGISANGGEAIGVVTDISKTDDVRNMIDQAVAKYGRLDVLFNNAGVDHMNRVVDTTEEEWDRVMNINLRGTWLCSKHAIPALAEAGGGSMVHTSSLSALKGRMGNSCYGAAKAGVLMLSQVMAVELAPQKIRSNCICPVVADTPMGERFLQSAQKLFGLDTVEWDPVVAKQIGAATIPLAMLCDPDDVAYAAVYLASDESKLVTGTYILVDGGSRAG